MNIDMPLGVTAIEKILGVALIIMGAFFAYSSAGTPTGDVGYFTGIFVLFGVVVAVAGFLVLLIKRE
ncbi:MAG: hypothetical protein NWF03_07645 [Candidatus Bathyarchaeota archaeon]|nr:hypothetical protein [Candidatus Bathyarchaeota archaeon]